MTFLKRAVLGIGIVTPVLAVGPDALVAKSATELRIVQTNSAGTTVSVIDPEKNTVVGVVHGIEVNRSAAASPDGKLLYVTNQVDSELAVVDARTFQIAQRMKLDGRPDHISINKDGHRLYISLASNAVEVVDTASLQKVASIPIEGAVHYSYLTPDGKYMVAASVGGRTLTVVDTKTNERSWMLKFEGGVRPIAFETNPDGSTKRMFVQISELHGFVVVDFATHQETTRITFPDIPGKMKNLDGIQGAPAHGIGISPDGKTLWALSKWYGQAYAYSMPDLKLLGSVEVGLGPEWLTFTPDRKRLYVSLAGDDAVAVVDPKKIAVVAKVPVGYVPKFNMTARLEVP
jgi:YVTN family beta-propeller protein